MAKKRLFGTFGVRRTANDVLTPEFASRLAASYGSIVQGTFSLFLWCIFFYFFI